MIKYLFAYRHAFVAGVLTAFTFFVMQYVPTWIVFLSCTVLWVVGMSVMLRRLSRRLGSQKISVPLLSLTAVAFMGLTSLVEVGTFRYALDILAGVTIFLLYSGAIHETYDIRTDVKRWRRFMIILWGFNVYAILTTLFAFVVFFATVPIVLFALFGGAVAGYASYQMLRLYDVAVTRDQKLWATYLGLLVFELFFILAYALPFGYLASGLLAAWPWYVAELLVRFQRTHRGIEWGRQTYFLLVNGLLYGAVIWFVIRWV